MMKRKILILLLIFASTYLAHSQKPSDIQVEGWGFVINSTGDTIRGEIEVIEAIKIKLKPFPINGKKKSKTQVFLAEEIQSLTFIEEGEHYKFTPKKVMGRRVKNLFPEPIVEGTISYYMTVDLTFGNEKAYKRIYDPGGNMTGSYGNFRYIKKKESELTKKEQLDRMNLYLEKNGQMFLIENDSFREQVFAFMKDCPEVCKKIGTEGYTMWELGDIVSEYNQLCGATK